MPVLLRELYTIQGKRNHRNVKPDLWKQKDQFGHKNNAKATLNGLHNYSWKYFTANPKKVFQLRRFKRHVHPLWISVRTKLQYYVIHVAVARNAVISSKATQFNTKFNKTKLIISPEMKNNENPSDDKLDLITHFENIIYPIIIVYILNIIWNCWAALFSK